VRDTPQGSYWVKLTDETIAALKRPDQRRNRQPQPAIDGIG